MDFGRQSQQLGNLGPDNAQRVPGAAFENAALTRGGMRSPAKGWIENCFEAFPWLIARTLNGAEAGSPLLWPTTQSFRTTSSMPFIRDRPGPTAHVSRAAT